VGARRVSVAVVVLLLAPVLTAAARPGPRGEVLDELFPTHAVAPGITHREFSTTAPAGRVRGDVVEVDLTAPGIHADLLSAGAVAARSPVRSMADGARAAAGINGDFFDIGGSNAAVGPEVQGGKPIKAAVPPGRRYGPAVPGAHPDDVFAVGTDRVGRVDRLALDAHVRGPGGAVPAVALNQHAVPVGGIGIVTAAWGAADRGRTLCGSDVDPRAPCAQDRVEVRVRDGAVASVGAPGKGTLGPTEIALEGREQGAAALRTFAVGTRVEVDYALRPASGVAPAFAIGGCPIVRGHAAVARLDTRERAPRSAVGVSAAGRHMRLVTVDGRQAASVGLTLAQLGTLLVEMGLDDAVNLDGGGSSTLVYRAPGAGAVTVVNDPSDPSPRLVPNGIGVWAG
jgi:Phosphodiester glycosidase